MLHVSAYFRVVGYAGICSLNHAEWETCTSGNSVICGLIAIQHTHTVNSRYNMGKYDTVLHIERIWDRYNITQIRAHNRGPIPRLHQLAMVLLL